MKSSGGRGGYVDFRTSLALVGSVAKLLALAPLFPLVVAIYYDESLHPFLVATAVMVVVGLVLERLHPDPAPDLGHREAFLLVSLTWLVVPVLGTIPYLVAGQGTVAHPVNALFESMSGFTTTGATALREISFDRHSRSILMWRQLTQWLGGMGIIVLMVAILPKLSVGGAQLIEEEAPGFAIDKLTPRIQETARVLWLLYAAFTVVAGLTFYSLHLVGFAPNMDVFNAVAHALTTLPTGGFSPEARSIEAFSPVVQWAVIPFMLIAGVNFALYWHVIRGNYRQLIDNEEFRTYLLVTGAIGGLLAVLLYTGAGLAQTAPQLGVLAGNVENALRQAAFQAVAIVTTTGYASMDFNTWDQSAQTILLLAMFFGGSAGSAAGSIKMIRWYVIWRSISRELFTSVHPEAVRPIRFAGEAVEERAIRSLLVFTLLFMLIFALSTVLIFLDGLRAGPPLSALEAMSVAIATLGNIGPGVGIIGPMNSYAALSNATKLYLVFLMWIGRLEIISVLVILSPDYWKR